MPWKYTEEYYREYTRTTWNESAEAYGAFTEKLAPWRQDLIHRLSPSTGDRILDLAAGRGEPSLTIGASVGSSGRVLGVDLSERMVELASATARDRKLPQVEFRVMDCERLDLKDGEFDAVVSAFGFQIFTNPEAAAAEAHRVLRPGGRIAVSVWGRGESVPFLHAIVGPMLEDAEPDETGYLPSPYETGGPGEMVAFLETSGFRDADERRITHTVDLSGPEEYLNLVLRGTPLGHSLSEESDEVQRRVLEKTRANLKRWRTPDGLSIPAEAVIVGARR